MGDQVAIGTRSAMDVYAGAFLDTKAARNGEIFRYPHDYKMHENIAYSTFYRGIAIEELPIGTNTLLNPPPPPASRLREYLLRDIGEKPRHEADTRLLEALDRDGAIDPERSRASYRQTGPLSAGCGVIVFDGDSISAGIAGSSDKKFIEILNRPARIHNVAAGGRPASECLRRFADSVAPLFEPTAMFNLIVFHAGDNDIAQGKSAAETYGAFKQYVAAAHAQGWKVVVSTELQRVDWSVGPQGELAAYNAQLLSNTAGADAVVDLAAEARLADLSRRTDFSLFSEDRIHPSEDGYAILAQLLAAGARSVLPQ